MPPNALFKRGLASCTSCLLNPVWTPTKGTHQVFSYKGVGTPSDPPLREGSRRSSFFSFWLVFVGISPPGTQQADAGHLREKAAPIFVQIHGRGAELWPKNRYSSPRHCLGGVTCAVPRGEEALEALEALEEALEASQEASKA